MGIFDDIIPPDDAQPSSGPLRLTVTRPGEAQASLPPKAGGLFDDLIPPDGDVGPTRQVGPVEAFATGAENSFTANFGDELRGARAASGVPDLGTPLNALTSGTRGLVGLARLGYEYLSGGDEAARRYASARDEFRDRTKLSEEQQPGASLAGNLVGAVALPVPGAALARGAGLGARVAASALTGGVVGAVAGAGQGEGTIDRLAGSAQGAVGGTVLGAALPVASRGVEALGRGAAALARPVVNQVRALRDPEAEASRRVYEAIRRDTVAGSSGIAPAEYAANRAAGEPVALMDLGGETTRALVRSAANTSPEGREALNRTVNSRYEGQSDRISGWLRGAFHYPDAAAQQTAIQDAARNVNRAAYRRAYHDGEAGLWSDELERLAGSPAVAGAMRSASTRGKDIAITEGMGGFNPRVRFTPDGRMEFARGPSGVPTYPDLQFWDYTRRELSDAARSAYRAGRDSEGSTLTQLSRRMNEELDNLVPSYQQARAGAAQFFGAENALEAGQNFVGASQRYGIPQARSALANMTENERRLFQDGYVSRLIERIDRVGDRRNVLNQIAQSGPARTELQVALGRERAAELETRLRVEGIMDLARGALQGNSTTARQLTELGLAGGTYTVGTGGNVLNPDPQSILSAALVYGAARGRARIDQRVSRHVAELLASNEPRQLQRGLTLATRSGMLESLRRADMMLARVGAQNANSVPGVQSIVPGSADEQQPDVRRPAR